MSAKELKEFIAVGQALGYTGEELRQFIHDERMRLEKQKEDEQKQKQRDEELKQKQKEDEQKQKQVEKEEERKFEMEKLRMESAAKEKQMEVAAKEKQMEVAAKEKQMEMAAKEKEKEREEAFELEKLKMAYAEKQAQLSADIEREKISTRKEVETENSHRDSELQLKRLELDAQLRQSASESSVRTEGNSGGVKNLKLPLFNDEKDDLDAFLCRFERACQAYAVKSDDMSMQLARLLQGRALEVYQRLADDEIGDYEVLKTNLLKRFCLTEGGYRKQFKSCRIEGGETPEQYVYRLKRYLSKWREMAGFEHSYEGLEALLLRDQFFITCDRNLQMFLKEKGKMTLKDMTHAASCYLEAHGPGENNSQQNGVNKFERKPFSKPRPSENTNSQVSVDRMQSKLFCNICKKTNHNTDQHRKIENTNAFKPATGIRCYYCDAFGHRKADCPRWKSNSFQKAAAIQVISEQPNQTFSTARPQVSMHQSDREGAGGEVKLASGDFIPIIAGAWSPHGQSELQKWKTQMTPCCRGKVNDVETEVLRDTGSTTCVVRTSLIRPDQMTGKSDLCMLIDGAVKRYPTAMVSLDTPYYKGVTKVLCMDSPVQDIIVGNIPGALGPEMGERVMLPQSGSSFTCNTETHKTLLNSDSDWQCGNNTDMDGDDICETQLEVVNDDSVIDDVVTSEVNDDVLHDSCNETAAAVQTRAMKAQEDKPPKLLKVTKVSGLDVTREQLIEMQQSDITLKKYIELASSPGTDNNKQQFIYHKGILYRQFKEVSNDDARLQLVVPECLREKVVSLAHDTLLAGHRGPKKTLSRVTFDFYWPGIHGFVSRYTASCDLCQRNASKGTVGRAPLGKLPLVGTPYSVVCVDLVGPLSPPSEGHRYILTVIDMCTRYPDAIPLKDISSATVAEALVGIFSRVGIPHRVHSDCGSQFKSEMMNEVYRLLSVKPSTTTPYHAMGNGVIENFNKTIKNMLKKVTSERPKDWHRYLTPLMFAVRDTPQDSTGFTPFELLYGRSVRTPMTMLKELWADEVPDPETRTTYEYVLDLRQRIEDTCALAKEELAKVQCKNQMYYNRKTRERKLNVGDSVLLLLPTEHNKLTLAWRGPFKVTEKVGNVDYRIEVSPGKIKTFHINMLKRYYHRVDARTKSQTDKSDLDDVDKEVIAAVACVLEDEEPVEEFGLTVNDSQTIQHYNLLQKETVKDVVVNPELPKEQQIEIREILKQYSDIFTDIPKVTNLMEHKVELTNHDPIRCKAYPIPYKMQEVIDKEIESMLTMGVIERSEAPYASPLVLVKKTDGTYRVCVNFKPLNTVTVFDPEPMMSPDEIFPKLAGSNFYSTFDFSKGYWAIPMEEKSKDYTSFITSRGLMRFKVMPFGMVNAGSTYNRMVRKLLKGSQNLENYVDDVLGHTKTWEHHVQILRDFFDRVRRANLTLRPSKCKIGFGEVDFLGHTINGPFIGPRAQSVNKIQDIPKPDNKKACRSLIGAVNFYRRYIPNCAELLAPITDLTKNRAPNQVHWGEAQEKAFVDVKRILSSGPILKLPDLSKVFILQTDASNLGMGACLMQEHDGKRHPVMYASKKFLPRERNYSVGEREALAIVWAVSKFHQYLYGTHFILESDHRPLEYFNTTHSSSPRLMRWSLALQPYRYTVKYIRGAENVLADYLSRC